MSDWNPPASDGIQRALQGMARKIKALEDENAHFRGAVENCADGSGCPDCLNALPYHLMAQPYGVAPTAEPLEGARRVGRKRTTKAATPASKQGDNHA